ncbi:hypothetical protein GQ600_14010 [Phytophthora cactorum]|nr:hypothetical protein GQ600_14010 [Phytophthora cactorum]
MAQDEVETLEAALKFISQYELSTDAATTETKAVNVTSAFQHSHKLNKTHSLEIPERSHAFKHSHSLEIPEETNAAFDPDLEIQDFLNLSVRPTLNETKPQCGTIALTAIPSPSLQPRRRLSKKEEIRDLRDTVAELSHQLDQLQASSTPNSPAEEEARVGFILSKPESLWQQVAARQLLLRQKAEETNAQLRKLAETRVRQTKNLKRMLSRRNDAEVCTLEQGFSAPWLTFVVWTQTLELIGLKRRKQMFVTGPPPTDNAEVFAKLVQGTDELYVGLDKLYVEQGMPHVPCPGRKRQVQRDAVNGAIAVFLDKNKVPFDLEKTQKAVWKLLSGRHRKDGPYTQVSSSATFGQKELEANRDFILVREVARKYVTEDRATFICRSVMEPTPTGESGRIGLKFNETMTVVVRRGEPLSSGQETSIIESYLCATRHDEGSAAARRFRGEVYVDIAIEGWEQSYASNNQDIENLLFEDAIQVG